MKNQNQMTPQQNQILNMHADSQWHCPTKELYMKDDRKRYSELRRKGYKFESRACELGHNHNSRVFMRKLIEEPGLETHHCGMNGCYQGYNGNYWPENQVICSCACPGCDPMPE